MFLVIAFTIVFVTTVGNLLELGENNRYRFMFDPFVWAVVWVRLPVAADALMIRRQPAP
jgi:hypothetical protein